MHCRCTFTLVFKMTAKFGSYLVFISLNRVFNFQKLWASSIFYVVLLRFWEIKQRGPTAKDSFLKACCWLHLSDNQELSILYVCTHLHISLATHSVFPLCLIYWAIKLFIPWHQYICINFCPSAWKHGIKVPEANLNSRITDMSNCRPDSWNKVGRKKQQNTAGTRDWVLLKIILGKQVSCVLIILAYKPRLVFLANARVV